jgi:hypothetical protein
MMSRKCDIAAARTRRSEPDLGGRRPEPDARPRPEESPNFLSLRAQARPVLWGGPAPGRTQKIKIARGHQRIVAKPEAGKPLSRAAIEVHTALGLGLLRLEGRTVGLLISFNVPV